MRLLKLTISLHVSYGISPERNQRPLLNIIFYLHFSYIAKISYIVRYEQTPIRKSQPSTSQATHP